jgi:hypothetical protein
MRMRMRMRIRKESDARCRGYHMCSEVLCGKITQNWTLASSGNKKG